MSRLFLWMAAACAVGACGGDEPNIATCGDGCPEVSGGGRDGSADDAGDAERDAGPSEDDDTAGRGGGGRAGRGASGRGAAGEGTAGAAGSAGEGGSDASMSCGDCPAERPLCSADATCVECLLDGDCDEEVCVDGACVACRQDADCEVGVCADGACVACKQDSDCTDPASSHCVEHACTPCSASAECAHIEGLTVCDEGQCVQCTGVEYESCGSAPGGERHVCHALTRTCSTNTRGSAGTCNPCVSDAQCEAGQLCMMQYYDEVGDTPDQGELEVAHVCFWRLDATELGAPSGDCVNSRPFVARRDGGRSIEGTQASVCGLRQTTCAGYKDYGIKPCSGPSDDATCGDPRFMGDAYCEEVAASTYACTTPCLSNDDCDEGFACAGTPAHCAL